MGVPTVKVKERWQDVFMPRAVHIEFIKGACIKRDCRALCVFYCVGKLYSPLKPHDLYSIRTCTG